MIILAGTPLGNDADASQRLKDSLESADLIAAEDTRRLLNLVGRLGVEIHAPVIAYHDHNEAEKAPDLIAAAKAGKAVVVVSDAGMPSVSDPGYRLAALAAHEGVGLTVVPGPSAVLTALAISGLASDRFSFEGFLARKSGERQQALSKLARDEHTMIFFESPRRLHETLKDMSAIFGADRPAAVARELTKVYEEVARGSLAELVEWSAGEIKGEISIVVGGYRDDCAGQREIAPEVIADVKELVELGVRMKDAAGFVAQRAGLRKNVLYQAVLGS
ncbi:16S rRNA (cytidine(1402)-2'-O)-methyltransferase [Arcanobacterium pinnipediorum]|uniref:Ribosomal RNA small subunit methyltransferase I n=1 Tax=Arcanobacterium pinnipediorum TaxID=1503041 RepID=A0ABY5AH97_9ACTO|nr:16S rRNA (cytidine(1402)-2'-O)-methyltransferase [Arcanobacterium pinnipediorum]USR79227.1 16S rRNA (cytidine(1402)-2'-O)-methyltransferase [Arcanobacterium pinnipediorum]